MVARVAASLIRPKTSRYVRDVLRSAEPESLSRNPKKLMTSVSNWADQVSDSFDWSSELHFAHTPFRACAPFDKSRDCGFDGSGRCIVTAVANYTMRAGDFALEANERAEAVKFLIHFVADMHQPLHLGFADDFGGNRIDLTDPEGLSLHEAWDIALIERAKAIRGSSWYAAALSMVDNLDGKESEGLEYRISEFHDKDEVEVWATRVVTETIMAHTCDSAYKNEHHAWIKPGEALTETYMANRAAFVDELLMKASVRLAHVLDIVADRYLADEREAEAAVMIAELASRSAVKFSKNPFESLYMEFDLDVDNVLFEVEVSDDESEEDYAESELEVEKTTHSPKIVKPVVTTTTLSPEEKKREQNRKKKLKAKISKRKMFGVDVESLVLIKRGRKYYVTDIKFVTSDTFIPNSFMIVNVKFAGNSATDAAPIPFLFDTAVFSTDHKPEPELVRAVFKKLGGMDYSTEAAASTSGRTVSAASLVEGTTQSPDYLDELNSYSIVGMAKDELKEHQRNVISKSVQINTLLAEIGLPPTDMSFADESTIQDMLKAKMSNKALRLGNGGELPTDEVRIRNMILSLSDELVFFHLGKIILLSTREYLVDRKNMRFVFNRVSTINSKISMTESYHFYTDTRLLDEDLMPSHYVLIDQLCGRKTNRDVMRDVLRRGSPILDRLKALGDSLSKRTKDSVSSIQSYLVFSSIRQINRKGKNYETLEYVIRDQEEERRICSILQLPQIPRLRPEDFASRATADILVARQMKS